MGSKQAPQDLKKHLNRWSNSARALYALVVVLGILSTLSSLVVTTFTADLQPLYIKVWAFTAALSVGLITAFDIPGKASRFRSGWRILNTAITIYENDDTSSLQVLYAAYSAAETILGGITYQAGTAQLVVAPDTSRGSSGTPHTEGK